MPLTLFPTVAHSVDADSAPLPPRIWALIPCAGTGSRAMACAPVGPSNTALSPFAALVHPPALAPLAKQYQLVAGAPMVVQTLAAFASVARLAATMVAVAAGDRFLDAYQDGSFTIAECGGPTRAATVRNGIAALQQLGALATDWVLVHDAARCLVTGVQIDRLIDACLPDGVGGLLAQPVADTLKTASHGAGGLRVAATVARSDKWLAQTPQMFRCGVLAQALDQAGEAVTDEASAVEAIGLHPLLVPGDAQNFKVTFPADFALAQAVLAGRAQAGTLDLFGGDRGEAAQLPPKTIF